MKRILLLALAGLSASLLTGSTARAQSPDPPPFEYGFGVYLQGDAVDPDPDEATTDAFDPRSDSDLRRARLSFDFDWRDIEFKVEGDFARGGSVFTDVYLGWKSPIGGVRIGHFKEPYSLEEMTSSKSTAFMERSLGRVFSPARNAGILVFDRRGLAPEPGGPTAGDRFFWAVGAFRESEGLDFSSDGGELNLTGRLVWLPLYADEGKSLFHLGLSATRKDPGDGTFRFRQRPSVRFSPRFVDTGSFIAKNVDVVDLEWAFIHGRFWASGEIVQATADSPGFGDPTFDAFYAQAGFFLTGESRPYSKSKAAFGGVKPKQPLFGGGAGAVEVAARWAELDLEDGAIAGGELEDLTLGVNWYPTRETRVMLNYVQAERIGVGETDYLAARVQFAFGFH